ncbi:MarR family transcriptional regulator [Altererythrobacter indicus]|uniref:MarR family transcriptional regulator n=1 Tax=Altericroceibacterium indicum TaxID=374177 RepID=A0A845A7D8_9SPHN|nr:MarR family transcriptional regulator [Altericroceibacterium indicum]MXP25259.1 MarR family transcriptional regulator [Altericroceibacterium indicum]
MKFRAREIYSGAVAGKRVADLLGTQIPSEDEELLQVLGDLRQDAVRIVENFALGAAYRYIGKDAGAGKEAPAEFFAELSIILNGFLPLSMSDADREYYAALQPKIFQSELWQVLRKVRESAELSYAREIELAELDRRILFLLRSVGPLPPAGISSAAGVDKAQVSRSVKRLLSDNLVERTQIRSPINLTNDGLVLADRLMKLAELRNRELTFGVDDSELANFFSTMELLLDRAVMLYEKERDLAQYSGAEDIDVEEIRIPSERRSGEEIMIDRSSIVSPLLTLSAYFSRSAALVFKRLTGLSNFEAWVLSEISQNPPIEWSDLVSQLDRDHSQSGRTINSLIERGLVAREGRPIRRLGSFSPTEKGVELYSIISDVAMKRSDFLMAPLSGERLDYFMRTFNKIRRNAFAQLERERAFEEIEAGQ